jgi:hypothetical protein
MRVHRSWLVAFLLISLAGSFSRLHAVDDKTYQTYGLANGRSWMGLDRIQRVVYLSGAMDGLRVGVGFKLPQKFICNCEQGEVAEGITPFYQTDPVRMAIPVVAVIPVYAMKAKGATPEQIDAEVRRLLKLNPIP